MSLINEQLRRAAVVAAAAYVTQVPYLVYLARVAYPDAIKHRYGAVSAEDLLALDLMRVAVLVILAALIGAFFSERNGLPGLGTIADVKAALPWIAGATALALVSQAAGGGEVARALPGQFPCEMRWAAVAAVKGAVFDEVVARYGMMTLMVGVLRRKNAANIMQAIFFAVVGARALFFDGGGGGPGLNALTLASLGASFVVALLAGHVYARHGLFAAVALHAAVGLRFIAHALLSSYC